MVWGSIGLNTQVLRNALKKYGRSGVATYLGLSTCVTTGFYVAIERNVDVKSLVGIKDDDPDAEPSTLQRLLLGPGSHLALAVLCSKAMIPLKLPVAVALTPYVYRLEQRLLGRRAAAAAASAAGAGGAGGGAAGGGGPAAAAGGGAGLAAAAKQLQQQQAAQQAAQQQARATGRGAQQQQQQRPPA